MNKVTFKSQGKEVGVWDCSTHTVFLGTTSFECFSLGQAREIVGDDNYDEEIFE